MNGYFEPPLILAYSAFPKNQCKSKKSQYHAIGEWAAYWNDDCWRPCIMPTEENEKIAYVLTRFEGETWLDAALRIAQEKNDEPNPKTNTINSVSGTYNTFIKQGLSEEKAAWLTCQNYNLLEFIKL